MPIFTAEVNMFTVLYKKLFKLIHNQNLQGFTLSIPVTELDLSTVSVVLMTFGEVLMLSMSGGDSFWQSPELLVEKTLELKRAPGSSETYGQWWTVTE